MDRAHTDIGGRAGQQLGDLEGLSGRKQMVTVANTGEAPHRIPVYDAWANENGRPPFAEISRIRLEPRHYPYSNWRDGLFWIILLGLNLGLFVLPRR